MSMDHKFTAAAEAVQSLSRRPDNATLLRLYALFKQASVGDVEGEPPSAFDFKARAKYNAWADLEGMSSEDAKQAYIDLVAELQSQD